MKNIKTTLLLLLLIIGFTSCVKEDPVFDPDDSPNIIEIRDNLSGIDSPLGAVFPAYRGSYDIRPEIDVQFVIKYAGKDVAPQDIVVNLAMDPTARVIYNAWFNENEDPEHLEPDVDEYDELPTDLYTLITPTVTIPKGEREAVALIRLKTTQFDLTRNYGIGLKITSTSFGTISGNHSLVIFNPAAKNRYDAVYNLTGRLGPAADRPTFNTTTEWRYPDGRVQLVTANANSVDIYDTNLNFGGGINQWLPLIQLSTGAFSGLGQVRPRITFDLATNRVISVTNQFANPTNGRALFLDPNFDSSFNPTTRTLNVRFILTQPGFADLPIQYTFTFNAERQ